VSQDPAGSLLLLMALGVLVVVTWQLLPLVVPMLGCVAMAAVAVERRRTPAPVTPGDPAWVDPTNAGDRY
jgi:hypothetical protein